MRESIIEREMKRQARALGLSPFKFISPGTTGVADILILGPNRFIAFVEAKAPEGKPRPMQLHFQHLVQSLDHFHIISSSPEEVRNWLVLCLRKHRGDGRILKAHYRNWKGIEKDVEIRPIALAFESTEYHPEEQWLLEAIDSETNIVKKYALEEIQFYET